LGDAGAARPDPTPPPPPPRYALKRDCTRSNSWSFVSPAGIFSSPRSLRISCSHALDHSLPFSSGPRNSMWYVRARVRGSPSDMCFFFHLLFFSSVDFQEKKTSCVMLCRKKKVSPFQTV